MNQYIFQKRFGFPKSLFLKLGIISLPNEALLLVDYALSHPSSELKSDDGKITCLFLPANTKPLIQPMDQDIIENMKLRYRKCVTESLLMSNDETTVNEFWKRYSIKVAT